MNELDRLTSLALAIGWIPLAAFFAVVADALQAKIGGRRP